MLVVNGLVFGLLDKFVCKFVCGLLVFVGFSDVVCVVFGVFRWIIDGFGKLIMLM